jgi:hypothetical protein
VALSFHGKWSVSSRNALDLKYLVFRKDVGKLLVSQDAFAADVRCDEVVPLFMENKAQ